MATLFDSIKFGKEFKENIPFIYDEFYIDYYKQRDEYDNFLSQSIKLEHFINLNKDQIQLSEPKQYQDFLNRKSFKLDDNFRDWFQDCKNYQNSLSKVIFKDFNLKKINKINILIINNYEFKEFSNFNDKFKGKIIEDFIKYDFEVSEWVKEKFNL